MFGFVNPLLLFGLLGVAVPIAIHLLLRQRPRPRPWAAMIWLRAAVQVAQRRYRLTNLLLLLLRCLIALLIALAVARPSLTGLGQSGRVVLVVDVSTSMGPTSDGSPLATLAAQLDLTNLRGAGDVDVISVGGDVLLRYRGDWTGALRVLETLEVETFAGGLDSAAVGDRAQQLLDLIPDQASVVLVSDFRQDRGDQLFEFLSESVRELQRLRVGTDQANGLITEVAPPLDMRPGVGGGLQLRVQGDASGAGLQIDDGPQERVVWDRAATEAEGWVRLALPPLAVGNYLLRIELDDHGLLADNRIEFPLRVRDRVRALVVADSMNFVDVALEADPLRIDHRRITAQALASTPLPERGGILLLKSPPVGSLALTAWLEDGGILWSDWATVQAHPSLAAIAKALFTQQVAAASGRLRSGMTDLNENFGRTVVKDLATLSSTHDAAEVLLWADNFPLIMAAPVGKGWLVLEAEDLSQHPEIRTTGAIPEWTVRMVRQLSAAQNRVEMMQSGQPAVRDLELIRGGKSVTLAEGTKAQLSPGWWSAQAEGGSGIAVMPNAAEGILRALPGTESWSDLSLLAVPQGGVEWAWWLLLSLLLFLIFEGAFAAWAGKTYGR